MKPLRYLALCLTGAAGVAVLGARRPHVLAWDFVVLGLLTVMLLPLLEGVFLGARTLDGLRITFLCATLALGITNYFPTRLGLGAILLALGCAGELWLLLNPATMPASWSPWRQGMIWISPWLAWLGLATPRATPEPLNRLWLDFRDRYGLVWGHRVREQWNSAALHRSFPGHLTWFGWTGKAGETPPSPAQEQEMHQTLAALLHRFLGENTWAEPEA